MMPTREDLRSEAAELYRWLVERGHGPRMTCAILATVLQVIMVDVLDPDDAKELVKRLRAAVRRPRSPKIRAEKFPRH